MREVSRKDIGLRISSLRTKEELSMKTLAEKAGISERFLCDLEAGKKGCSASSLYRISKALAVPADYLLTGKEPLTADELKEIELTLLCFSRDELPYVKKILNMILDFSDIRLKK